MSARDAGREDVRDVSIVVDGRALRVGSGLTVAAALLNNGVRAFRSSVTGADRGPLCGMGVCYECRLTIGGIAHRRACLVPVAEGLEISTAPADTW